MDLLDVNMRSDIRSIKISDEKVGVFSCRRRIHGVLKAKSVSFAYLFIFFFFVNFLLASF